MLTKEEMEDLLDKKLKPIVEKINDLEDTVKDKTADLYTSVFTLRAELSNLERKMLRRFTEVRESQNIIIGFFEKEQRSIESKTNERLDRIEDHLKLPQI